MRVLKYGWGPANANALALRLGGAGWMVVSPALDAPANAYDELEREGGVSVLLAPNAYHYLGQAAWQRRFPKARSFAPRGALERLAKKADQAWWLRGLSRLAGSGPGYRRNARPELVYVNQPAAWLSSVRRVLMQHPPTLVVPAHGDAVVADAAQRTAAILA